MLRRVVLVLGMSLSMLFGSSNFALGQEVVQRGQPTQTPQGPGPAQGPGRAPLGAASYAPMTTADGAVGLVPAVRVSGVQAPGAVPTNLGGDISTVGPYTLGPDDVVHIDVRNQPEFTGTFVVGQNGMIQYGILGDIKANGLAKAELADVVAPGRWAQPETVVEWVAS